MKKLATGALALVLAASALTGCGCMNSSAPMQTHPTVMPTESIRPSTAPGTQPSTVPSAPSEAGVPGTEAPDMTGTTETTTPMTRESGKVKSHVNGNF